MGAQGSVGGAPAVVKVFDPRFPGSEEAMQHEWRVYEHLGRQGAQGVCTPRLLKAGEFYHTGALFLALSEEGCPLSEEGTMGVEDREAACAAVCALHAAGVVHGDICRANLVRGAGGAVKLVDFETASIVPLEDGNQGSEEALKSADLAAVDAL